MKDSVLPGLQCGFACPHYFEGDSLHCDGHGGLLGNIRVGGQDLDHVVAERGAAGLLLHDCLPDLDALQVRLFRQEFRLHL